MKATPFTIAAIALSAALVLGCNKARNADILAAGAPVPVPTAVGPVPGPEDESSPQTNPFANNRSAAGEGRRLFNRMNCSGCHGDHAGGGMGPSLRDEDWLYGNGDTQIFASITEGRAHGMPTWGPKLSPDQTWQLVTYIKTLRTPLEPQPPF
jgi:mono/diheme cytochrome c family protein